MILEKEAYVERQEPQNMNWKKNTSILVSPGNLKYLLGFKKVA